MTDIAIDKLIRSRRRSIAAEIGEDASLIIRAPQWASKKFIFDFIEERKDWILRNQALVREKYHTRPKRNYVAGEEFLFLGHPYKLRIGKNPVERLSLDNEFLLSNLFVNEARQIFVRWYQKRAALEIAKRAQMYAVLAGVEYKRIRISAAKRQWGSCSASNALSFSWRLVMAPFLVMDAVVVHELVHLKERNHSARFWKEVKSLFPDYDKADKWLDENSHLMVL